MKRPTLQVVLGPEQVSGALAAGIWTPTKGIFDLSAFAPNLLQYSGADAFAGMLAGQTTYMPAGMYIEFTNDILGWVAPAVTRDGAMAYFAGLGPPGTEDYLRVPFMVAPDLSSGGDNYVGNIVTFLAMTAGVVGKNGLDFGDYHSSCVVGGAVVAIPDWDDHSSDIIITRGYLDDPREKPAAPAEVILQWRITCG